MNSRTTIGARFAGWITGHPWLSIVLGLLMVGSAVTGFPHIKGNFTHTSFFYDDDPLLQAFNAFERRFGNDDGVILLVHSPSGIFDKDSAELLSELTEEMWQIPEVIRVDSLSNFNWVHAVGDEIEVEPLIPDDQPLTDALLKERETVALTHETLPDYFISRDGKSAIIGARIRPGFETPSDSGLIVRSVRALVAEKSRSDHVFHIHGGPAVNYSFEESTTGDSQKLTPFVLAFTFLFLLLTIRTVSGIVLPLLVMVLSLVGTIAMMGHLAVEFSTITVTLLYIMIAVSVADGIHIMVGFVRGRRNGLERTKAAHYTLSKNFQPTVLTTISTAIGFFAFATAALKPVAGLGLMAGVGTVLAWLMTYLVLGGLMTILPSRVKASGTQDVLQAASPRALRFVDAVQKRRWAIVSVFGVLCAGSLVAALQTRVNSDPYLYFREGVPIREANAFLQEKMGWSLGFEVVIDSGAEEGFKDPGFLGRVEALEKDIEKLDGITRTVSVVDTIRQMNRALNGGDQAFYKLPETQEGIAQEFLLYTMSLPQGMNVNDRVTVDNRMIRVSVLSNISDSSRWVARAEELVEMARARGLEAEVTGKGMLYQSMNDYVVRAFIQSLLIAVVAISLLLTIFFKSVRLGALAMLPNVVPLLFGGAFLNLLGVHLDIGTVLVSSVCLGIAVDDTIHVIATYNRHLSRGESPREAMGQVFSHTGPALVTTTMVLVAAFGVMAFGTFVPNMYFGMMTAVILTTALLTDLTFLPALLLIFVGRGTQKPAGADGKARADSAENGNTQVPAHAREAAPSLSSLGSLGSSS